MAIPTIMELQEELVQRIKSTTTFRRTSYAVYDMDDLKLQNESGIRYPMAGVAYEGGETNRNENDTHRNSGGSVSKNTFNVRFSVIIGAEYKAASNPSESKVVALSMLEEVRAAVLGFRGVNSRPWTLISERPLEGDLEGVIFYGQLWSTDIFIIGTHVEN